MRGAVSPEGQKAFLFQQIGLMTLRVDAFRAKNFRVIPSFFRACP
jgi:hypothetical protein